MTAPDTTDFCWLIEQGERETLSFPVLDDTGSPVVIAGWAVDAVIKSRSGGDVLYTWPPGLIDINAGGTAITLTVPSLVSASWTFTRAWFRVNVTDPTSDPADPATARVLQGRLVVSPD